MPDIQGIIAIIGAIALFAGLFGGFKAKDLEVPPLPKVLRFFAFLIGVLFIGVAIWPFIRKEILTASSLTVTPSATDTPEIAMTPTFTPELLPPDTPVPPTNTPDSSGLTTINTPISTATYTPQPTNTPTPNCVIATRLPDRLPVVSEPWILPSGGWIHLNFWSNEPGIDQTEHKILLGPDDPRAFLGGGSAWQFPDECESSARANFRPVPLPEISLEELRAQNLVVR